MMKDKVYIYEAYEVYKILAGNNLQLKKDNEKDYSST